LTFDDGPHPDVTPRLLDILSQYDARATFFLVGSRVLTWPHLAARIAEAGHTVGWHGFAHINGWLASPRAVRADLDRAEEVLGGIMPSPRLYRPPFGCLSPQAYLAARKRNFTCVLWSVSALDYKRSDSEYISKRLMHRARPGKLVLLHECRALTGEGYMHTVQAVERYLAYAEANDWRMCSLGDYVGGKGLS